MTDVFINETGCVVTRSGVTGDILCRWPGPDCDCLMGKTDESYAPYAAELDIDPRFGYAHDGDVIDRGAE